MLKANRLTKTNFLVMAEDCYLFVIKFKVFILIRIVCKRLLGGVVSLISGPEVSVVIIGNIEPAAPCT